MQDIGFDIIGDLHLAPDDHFNWENKATSLYCIIAGNISSDTRTIIQTLSHLSRFYQGVFYVPGQLEYADAVDISTKTKELIVIASSIPNVCLLHQQVAIIDGIAVLGSNGWADSGITPTISETARTVARDEDMFYLHKSIEKLQKHLDVKKIIVISNTVPQEELYFGEAPHQKNAQIPFKEVLRSDTEHKVTHWVFGTYRKTVDTYINDINFVNNPYLSKNPYWAKRITLTV
jgi:hypothetical protein